MRLAERCTMCSSSIWCGRQCKHAPVINVNNELTAFEKIEDGLNEALAIAHGEAKPASERQAKWRKANPDINRQRAREGMQKLRAKASGRA